jgi:hypothetical protein
VRPGPILTLDLAKKLGWCAGVPGQTPRFGTVQLRGSCHGEVYAALGNWLEDARQVHAPATIIFEAPLVSGQHLGMNAARLAFGMVGQVELFCWDNSITCLEEHVGRTRKAVMGRGSFPKGKAKEEVARWLADRGYRPGDDNAADALLLFLHVEQTAGIRQPEPGGMFARAGGFG